MVCLLEDVRCIGFKEFDSPDDTTLKDSVKALHTCSRFFKYLKTYAF